MDLSKKRQAVGPMQVICETASYSQLATASIATGARPVHSRLLGSDIPILEHLCNLGDLPDSGSRFSAAPVPIRGMGSFPVRAYAIVPG